MTALVKLVEMSLGQEVPCTLEEVPIVARLDEKPLVWSALGKDMMQIQFPQAPLVALVALVSLVALKAAPCVPLAHTFAAWLRHSQNWQVKVPDAPDIGRPPAGVAVPEALAVAGKFEVIQT